MSAIDTNAREVLSRRRQALIGAEAPMAGGPDARWTDYDSSPPPAPEGTRRELEEIDAALRRIGEGRYGQCEACSGAIGLQRLRAIPEARYCLACAGRLPEE